jgi:hypothetical protein
MSIEAMKQALEALEAVRWSRHLEDARTIAKNARYSLRQAIAEAEKQEPVVEVQFFAEKQVFVVFKPLSDGDKLYTAPHKPWVGLTDEEVGKYSDRLNGGDIAREVEAKLKERNT